MSTNNKTQKLQQYVIGGAVRDIMLGRSPKDIDYIWVGATPENMVSLGMAQVGVDFPVFLDSDGNEHALARKERKVGVGYTGFECDFDTTITLKDDQCRRDLTINQLAVKIEDWDTFKSTKDISLVIDEVGGIRDLKEGMLKHISSHFSDDPVRVLRVARFAARYGFVVDIDTLYLMQRLVNDGELDHLVPERVWTEFVKAMGENDPLKFFWVLRFCGAYDTLFGELGETVIYTSHALKRAVRLELDTVQRISIIFSGVPYEEVEPLLQRLKAPTIVTRTTRRMRLLLEVTGDVPPESVEVLDTLNKMDAFNNDLMVSLFTTALLCHFDRYIKLYQVFDAFQNAKTISFASLTDEQRDTLKGKEIRHAIDELRLKEIKKVFI